MDTGFSYGRSMYRASHCMHTTTLERAPALLRARNALDASPQRIWQMNYYEHIIRNERELNQIREYIIDTPRKWADDENQG